MDEKILEMARHIFKARMDNADSAESFIAWCSARDIFEYAIANDYECLSQFDYLDEKE